MSKFNRLSTKELVEKIEKLAKSKMAHEPIVSLEAFREMKKKTAEPKTVLVIEDDETMRAAIKRILDSEGYKTKLAADATDLSKVLDDTPIDLIILDIGLPWINGFELAQMLKENRDLRNIPLVFISGKATDEDVKHAFELGADEFIKKPFDVDKLKKTVMTLLKLNE